MPTTRANFDLSLTRELGTPGQIAPGSWLENWEETAELRWPFNQIVFDRMRRTDGRVQGCLRAINLPILRAHWHLDDGDGEVRPEVMEWCRHWLGLRAREHKGARRARMSAGIDFAALLRHQLLSLPLGYMPQEKVYEIGSPPEGEDFAGLPPVMATPRKIAPRMPRTIIGFDLDDFGELLALRQWVPRAAGLFTEVVLPRRQLVMSVNDREGADWQGQSILRAAYKHWLLKDVLLRLGPQAVERNGMGYPVVTFDPGLGNETKALEIARNVRGGEDTGAALPQGYALALLGVQGETKDEMPLLLFNNQEIGRATLTMFMDLGHDRGARSLGDTMVDFFVMAQDAVVERIGTEVTEDAIREAVLLNFGPDEPYPTLTAPPISQGTPDPTSLATLAQYGLLTPDPDLEDALRDRYGLPPLAEENRPDPEPDPPAIPGADRIIGIHLPGGPEVPETPGVSRDQRTVGLPTAASVAQRAAALAAQAAALQPIGGPR